MDKTPKRTFFPKTEWTRIVQLKAGEDARIIYDNFYQEYRTPLLKFAAYLWLSEHDAEDLVQTFFLEHIIEKNLLLTANQDRGRLRTFLMRCFTNHVHTWRRHQSAQKRGGQSEHLSIDDDSPCDGREGGASNQFADESIRMEECFLLAWAQALRMESRADLEAELGAVTESLLFTKLKVFLEPGNEQELLYSAIAEELGQDVGRLRSIVSDWRKKWRTHLRRRIGATLDNPTEEAIDSEMQILRGYFFREAKG